MYKNCLTCSGPFVKHVEKRDTNLTKKIIQDEKEYHYHYGVAYYQYGICSKHHFTRCEQTRIVWTNCPRCLPSKEQLTELEQLRKEVDLLKKILGIKIY